MVGNGSSAQIIQGFCTSMLAGQRSHAGPNRCFCWLLVNKPTDYAPVPQQQQQQQQQQQRQWRCGSTPHRPHKVMEGNPCH
ncbi:hypothetical protein PBY51_019112 [Eleginops maclovinus]|uniref:Uncharacterized protein n=1 Tax=Eleginops maclovinus TaxID=56733 RepID=A0AAN8AVG7_ELEMC|nr:hypothetical protein PBY51_019112 [Eleginops maclovinus]